MQKFLKPNEGALVRDPVTYNPLPKEGMLVDWVGSTGRYYRKRVKDGDCIIVDQSKKADRKKRKSEVKKNDNIV